MDSSALKSFTRVQLQSVVTRSNYYLIAGRWCKVSRSLQFGWTDVQVKHPRLSNCQQHFEILQRILLKTLKSVWLGVFVSLRALEWRKQSLGSTQGLCEPMEMVSLGSWLLGALGEQAQPQPPKLFSVSIVVQAACKAARWCHSIVCL